MNILQNIVQYKIARTHFTQARYQHHINKAFKRRVDYFSPGWHSRQSLMSQFPFLSFF